MKYPFLKPADRAEKSTGQESFLPASEALILNQLVSGYREGLHTPLSVRFVPGIHGIMAESGAGKTTLLKTLSGLIPPLSGSFTPMKNVLCFQEPLLLDKVKVKDNLAYARPKELSRENSDPVLEMIQTFELQGLEEKHADELSSGQRQRLSLAMAFLQKPPLLLLDESLSLQDQARKKRLIPRIKRLISENNMICLWVSHSEREIEAAFDTLHILSEKEWKEIVLPGKEADHKDSI